MQPLLEQPPRQLLLGPSVTRGPSRAWLPRPLVQRAEPVPYPAYPQSCPYRRQAVPVPQLARQQRVARPHPADDGRHGRPAPTLLRMERAGSQEARGKHSDVSGEASIEGAGAMHACCCPCRCRLDRNPNPVYQFD